MRNTLTTLAILIHLAAFSQTDPQEVTPAIQQKIKTEIEDSVLKIKAQAVANGETQLQIEFKIDTFRLEKYFELYTKYDYTTVGLVTAAQDCEEGYDKLLNKYYNKLLNTLAASDKQILIQAQKAWLLFRDSERKIIDVTGKEGYTGDGTVQQLINASEYLDLIKQRTIQIFNHLDRVTDKF
jgi:uncharacterized protein YecT (DUF1311 family)